MNFENDKGDDIIDIVNDKAQTITEPDDLWVTRYEFDDGSAIVVNGNAWDIGFTANQCQDPEIQQRVADSDGWGYDAEFVWPEAL